MADNFNLIADLFTTIEEKIFFGNRLTQREFIVFANPGPFVDPNGNEANLNDLYQQSKTLDAIYDTSFIYKPLPGTTSGQYWQMVDDAELPRFVLSPAQQNEVRSITAYLAAHLVNYRTGEGLFATAQDNYFTELYSSNPNPVKLRNLKRLMNDAMNDWQNTYGKATYESKQGRLNSINSGDPNVYWDSLRQEKNSALLTDTAGHDFYPANLNPPANTWNDNNWNHISFGVSDSSSSSSSSSTSWSGGASVGWGLWSFGVSAGGTSVQSRSASDTTNLNIAFEYRRVSINRDWLKEDALTLRSWRFKAISGHQAFSDGGNLSASPPVRPVGIMPLLTKDVLVVRNLIISGNFAHNDMQSAYSEFHAGGSIGWGPFSLSGSTSTSSSSSQANSTWQNGVIAVPNPQILGFLCTLLPQCPNPDLSLPWDTNITRENIGYTNDFLRMRAQVRSLDEAKYDCQQWYAEAKSEIEDEYSKQHRQLAREYNSKIQAKAAELQSQNAIQAQIAELQTRTGRTAGSNGKKLAVEEQVSNHESVTSY